jgi:hypothetical protein
LPSIPSRVRNYPTLSRSNSSGFPLPGARRTAEEIIEHLTRQGDREYWLVLSSLMTNDWLADVERLVLEWGDSAGVRIHVSWETHPTHGKALFVIRADHETWQPASRARAGHAAG